MPTILEALGLPPHDHLVEGRSLIPLMRGVNLDTWRDAVFSELDYSFREARLILKRTPSECRAIMVRTDRWKYVWWQDFRPMLFDLANDPQERRDLGADEAYAHIRREMEERLGDWLKARKTRVTVDDAYVGPHRHPQEARHLLRPVVIPHPALDGMRLQAGLVDLDAPAGAGRAGCSRRSR